MSVYEQIVRELAESDPQVGNRCFYCFGEEHSEMVHGYKYKFVLGPDDHKPHCLWLRAKQAVERADNSPIKITIHDRKPEPEVIVVPVPYPGPGGGMRA
jgi:hypothetical protein